jgi:hypothetical protein
MRGSGVNIEPIDDAAAFEVVELVAADTLSARVVSALPNDGVMARLVFAPRGNETPPPESTRSPMMVVVVGDLRGDRPSEAFRAMRAPKAVSVAVVVVDSLANATQLERVFDCVVPVLATPAVDPEPALMSAAAVVTAFATANRISIPVDEVYPFFVRAGRTRWGWAVDANVITATGAALAKAGVVSRRGEKRIQLHVESSERDHMTDLRLAAEVAWRTPNVARLELAVSARGASAKRVSVVAVEGR